MMLTNLMCLPNQLDREMEVKILIFTSLGKDVMFLVALVCLSVYLSVDNITQKVMNGLE